ncbi:MAG: hypothetical protein IJL17_20485 [Kiritimatiellae bacterium]|nr:hypothetical protein [Kiritimatiellia bacterium]
MSRLLIAAIAVALAGNTFALSLFGLSGSSWKDYDKAVNKGLPRTATNVLAKIEREALAKKDWPNAARAIITRANVERGIRDDTTKNWLPAFAARIDAAPAELQAVLQLHLAHVYLDESQPWRWGGARPTKLSDAAATNQPPWAPERLNETLEAQFAKVLAHAEDLKACRVDTWGFLTSRGTLPDSYRPTLFDVAVHDMLGFYGRTIPDKTLEKGLALLDRLVEFHRGDDMKDALADAELARLRHEHSFAQMPEKERDAHYATALDAFIARYLDVTDVSALAVHARAELMERAGDLVDAYAKAETGAKRWPESVGGRLCASLMRKLEQPDFTVKTERTWNAPWPDLVLKSKNMTNVWFRIVPVTFDDIRDNSVWDNGYYRASDMLRNLAKDKGARTWQVAVEDPRDFKMHESKFPVPSDLAPGHYVLFAAMDDRFGDKDTPLFTRIVTVTDLALAQAGGEGSVRGRVWRAESGEPAAGVTVECWESKSGRKYELPHTLKTGADGSFELRKDRTYGYLRVRDGAHEVLSLSTVGSGSNYQEKETFGHVDLLTDRAIYRPGQTIRFKGVAYYTNPHTRDFRVLPDAKVIVDFKDPNGKPVGSVKLTTNPWGSFHGELTAPRGRLTGSYEIRVRAHAEDTWANARSSVRVEEYKRPKFRAEFESGSADGVLGKTATVKGRARTYSGLPVQGARVTWRVKRSTSYSEWWCWLWGDSSRSDDEGYFATGETETDADGAFAVSFVPEPSPTADLSGEPTFLFDVSATVVDTAGETHAAEMHFRIGTVTWSAHAGVSERWLAVDGAEKRASVPAYANLHTLGGKPVSGKGILRVFALKGPALPVRKPAESGRYYDYNGRRIKEKPAPQPWNWERWEPGAEVLSRAVETDVKGGWKGTLDLPAGAYRLVFEAQDPQGKTVKAMDTCAVFDTSGERCVIAVPEFFRVKDHSVKAGDAIRLYWATGYATGYGRLTLTQNGKKIYDRTTDPSKPVHYLEFPVGDANRGDIYVETEFLRENRLYHQSARISVPWDNMDIKIKSEHFTSKLVPGTEEKWSFTVSAPSEMVALMYDKSLDAFVWHNPLLSFGRYFTPRTRWPSTPHLQNDYQSLYHLDGHFPGGGYSPSASWRTWKSQTRAIRMNSYRSRGFGVMADVACAAPEDDAAAGGRDLQKMAAPRAAAVPAARATAGGEEAPAKPETDVPARKNLQETAFFLPTLESDADGRVNFTFTVPDALTGWKFVAFAHDKGLRSGILRDDTIVTTKSLMAEPNAPRFVREGDDFLFAVKVTNTEDEPQKGTVSLAFEDAETLVPAPVGGGSQPFELKGHESKSFSFRVKIPDGQGFLKYTARAKGDTFADGEEGWLPVLSRSIFVREAVQLQVRGAGTRTFALTNLLASAKSDTIRNVDLTVRAVSRPAWYAVLALPYLMEFPHECCEQTFSRFYANALGAHIANSDPRIRATFETWKAAGGDTLKSPLEQNEDLKAIALDSTPWVREAASETASRRRVGQLFETERLASEQARCIEKLAKDRNGDGRWPWFPGGRSSDGITLYILAGFARLNHLAGVAYPDFFKSACIALDREVVADIARRVKEAKKLKMKFHACGWDVQWLYLHSFTGVSEADPETKKLLLKHIADEWLDFGLETQAYAAIVLHRFGKKGAAKDIIASLKERAIVSDEMGMYWKRSSFYSSSLFAAPVSTQAVIIEAFMEVTGDVESVDACRAWLLKQKQTQNWSSTASTVDAIYAILLGGGTDLLAGDTLATVTLGGKEVPKANAEAGTGLYTHKVPVKEIKPEMGAITFSNDAKGGVAWGGVHWSYFEDVLKVRAHEPKELHVVKKYYRKVRGTQGTRLAPIEGALEVGDELVARIVLTSDRIFEYVHVQDERPACAEPVDVLSRYRWQDGVGYYQSTRDTATHYYIDRLGKGTFVLETSFRVQQRGTFVGGLATVQCMYAPEFTAHSSAERVEAK